VDVDEQGIEGEIIARRMKREMGFAEFEWLMLMSMGLRERQRSEE